MSHPELTAVLLGLGFYWEDTGTFPRTLAEVQNPGDKWYSDGAWGLTVIRDQ